MKLWRVMRFAVIAAPAMVALAWITWLGLDGLEPVDFLRLRREPGPMFRTQEFFSFSDGPAYFTARLLDFGLLRLPWGSLAHARFLVWGGALVFCLLMVRLLREQIFGSESSRLSSWVRAGVLLSIAAWIFSPAWGANWLFVGRLRMLGPVVLFLAGLLLLRSRRRCARPVALGLAILAVFCERSGSLVWVALLPMVWLHGFQSQDSKPFATVAWWALWGNVATLLSQLALRRQMRGEVGLLGALSNDPGFVGGYGLDLVGDFAPRLIEGATAQRAQACVLLGLFFALSLVMFLRRQDEARRAASLPFWSCGLFALAVAVELLDSHVSSVLPPSFLREFMWPGCLLITGIGGLLMVQLPRVGRVVLPVFVCWLVVASAADWHRGFEHLKVAHAASSSRVAAVALLPAGVPGPVGFHAAVSPTDVAALQSMGWLRDAPTFSAAQLNQRVQAAELPGVGRSASGDFTAMTLGQAAGQALAHRFVPPPSLILLTRTRAGGDERVFQMVDPNAFVGGKQLPWSVEFPEAELFEAGEVVRACAYHLAGDRFVRLTGSFRFNGVTFVAGEPR